MHNGLHEAPPNVRIPPLPSLGQWRWRGWLRPRPWSSTTIHETSVTPIIKFRRRDNLFRTSGPCSRLRSDILLQGIVEGLLPVGELEDDVIPVSHCC